MVIDLNCDLGEAFGAYAMGDDAAMMELVTSVNIACGFHAGDPLVMRRTVQAAVKTGLAIGAHPGYPDLQGFGRRDMAFGPGEITALVMYQVGALQAFCAAEGTRLSHVKPHGALYNQAMKAEGIAAEIVDAVIRLDPNMTIVALPHSVLSKVAAEQGLRVMHEGFPDRGYAADGSLLPRSMPGAVIEDPDKVAENAVGMAQHGVGGAQSGQGTKIDTLCLHGDHPRAVENARRVRAALERNGITVQKP